MSVGLAIFVKTAGYSPLKTRLAADRGDAWAQAWYRHAATAVAAVVRNAALSGVLAPYWAVAEPAAIARGAWPGFPMLGQGTGGLGERMARVHAALVEKHGAGILIGADAPQLSVGLIDQAVCWLQAPDSRLIMGPARDGGFWLFGGNRVLPTRLWCSVRYSEADTGRALQTAMEHRGDWHILPTLTDVDDAGDLDAMLDELHRLSDRQPEQQRLVEWMRRLEGVPT